MKKIWLRLLLVASVMLTVICFLLPKSAEVYGMSKTVGNAWYIIDFYSLILLAIAIILTLLIIVSIIVLIRNK